MAGRFFMNKNVGHHMGASHEEMHSGEKAAPAAAQSDHAEHEHGGGNHPQIHIHSHAKGHTVHVMHSDGRHEKHEHESGDTEGIKSHIDTQLGGGMGQDHGFSSGEDEENEFGAGPGV